MLMPTHSLIRFALPVGIYCVAIFSQLFGSCSHAQPPTEADQAIDFERDVLPIFKQRCLDCHGPETQEAQLRLDSLVGSLRGGDSGEQVIRPGDSSRSYLIERLTTTDASKRMPPDEDALPDAQIKILRAWIDAENLWHDARRTLESQQSKHWSFQPLTRPSLPPSAELNPIDAFIAARLASAGLQLSPTADRRRLIRRLYLVMHGLPPSSEQVAEFVADEAPRAWENLVERVLRSPRYGERWATHWLDIVRFGETDGFETNRERPNAYHYRDWVINAFNTDKPYDQFVKQQIAGDALGEPIGTGFLVAGPNDIVKGQDPLLGLMQRQDELTDMVNATGTTFLGLTTGCARCHNHKFDPITQTDFYAMEAVFAGVQHGESELPAAPDKRALAESLSQEIEELRKQLAKYTQTGGTRDAVNAQQNVEAFASAEAKFVRFTILATNASEPCIDELQVFAGEANVALATSGAMATSSGDFVHPLHKLEHINDGKFGNARSWISSAVSGGWVQFEFPQVQRIDRIVWGRDREGRFADRLAIDYRIEGSTDGAKWFSIATSADRLPFTAGSKPKIVYSFESLSEEEAKQAREKVTRIENLEKEKAELANRQRVYAGRFSQPAPVFRLYRGDPTAPRDKVTPGGIATLQRLELSEETPEQQRRIALANWIADPSNPLTARVIVNRLWQFHFGTGIVDTPGDFGANGTPPSHPELLDWLASELISQGWSLKQLHRIILTSKTWQQDSAPTDHGLQVDAASRLLWRFPPRRLEAEGIRDCILQASGVLDLQTAGPGFSAFEVDLENVRHYFPKKDFGPADWRRMIYMNKVRQERDAVFGAFDCPDASQVTPKRSRSTTPLQALNLLNSRFVMQQAEIFARRLNEHTGTTELQVASAFDLCYGRAATTEELAEAREFVEQFGLVEFARALLNSNEFVFIP